jgi:4-azaleucine resistance transporter AzlC
MSNSDFGEGVRTVAPVLLGVVPFALVAGVAAASAGLSLLEAMGMSVIVFAGASQLAALDLLSQDAPLAVVVVTAAVINLRMMMYSASIAPHFRSVSARWKAVLAYLLTDQAYALSLTRYGEDDAIDRKYFYLGTAATLWVVWQLGTLAGVLLGAGVPDSWGLEFAVPLVFLAVLVPALEDRASVAAGVVAAVVAIVGGGLPLNLGLLVAAAVGIVVGMVFEEVSA